MASEEDDEINRSSTSESVCDGKVPCSPCEADGRRLEAVGYCETCKEYLCETCFKYHRLPSLMRKHVLIDQEQMRADWKFSETNICEMHPERRIEYHCPTHAFLGCHVCVFRHQESCKDSKYIADIVDTFASSEEVNTFRERIENVASKAKVQEQKAKRKPDAIHRRSNENKDSVRAFTTEIISDLKSLEKSLIGTIDALTETDKRESDVTADKCVAIQNTSLAMSTEIEVLQNKNKNFDLYIHVVKSKGKLSSLEDEMKTVERSICGKTVKFKGNKNLSQILKAPWGLGEVVQSDMFSRIKHIESINIQTGTDGINCCVRGAVIMHEDQLVITDLDNKKLKIVDTNLHKVMSEISLPYSPRSVTKVTETTVAVAAGEDKKILIVNTDPAVGVEREFDVMEKCHGVAYCNGNLIVTYCYKNKAEVMDLHGHVLRVIGSDTNGKTFLKAPVSATVNLKHKVIYISNRDYNNVVCVDYDGTVLATFDDVDLKGPFQTAIVTTDVLLVSGRDSKNIHLITSDCKSVKVLIKSTDSLTMPRTICYNEKYRQLYVGDGRFMRVFQVS